MWSHRIGATTKLLSLQRLPSPCRTYRMQDPLLLWGGQTRQTARKRPAGGCSRPYAATTSTTPSGPAPHTREALTRRRRLDASASTVVLIKPHLTSPASHEAGRCSARPRWNVSPEHHPRGSTVIMSREEWKPSMIQQLLWFVRTYVSRDHTAAGEASMLMPCNAMPCSHAMLSCSRACRPVARCPGQKHLDLCSGFMRAASARLAITRMCVIVDASSAIRSVSIDNHPASQARQDDLPPVWRSSR